MSERIFAPYRGYCLCSASFGYDLLNGIVSFCFSVNVSDGRLISAEENVRKMFTRLFQ